MANKRRYVTEEYHHKDGQPWLVVTFRWRDAASMGGWKDADAKLTPPICQAAGLLRSRTANGDIVICASCAADGDFIGPLIVPGGMLVSEAPEVVAELDCPPKEE